MFAILFQVLLIEIQEEIHHFAGWEGGVKGNKNCEQKSCEQKNCQIEASTMGIICDVTLASPVDNVVRS